MLINENYEHDINYTFELSRLVFRLLGIWPYARAKSRFPETLENVSVILVCFVLLICEVIPDILYIVQRETRARFKSSSITMFTMITIVKYGQLLFNRNRVRNYLVQVEDDWRNIYSTGVYEYTAYYEQVSANFGLVDYHISRIGHVSPIVHLDEVVSTIIPLSSGKIVTEQNFTISHLPCMAHFVLFDVQFNPAYEIVFLMQFFSGLIECTITTAACGIAGLFVMHICAQLEILVSLMNSMVNERELKNLNEKLAVIVKHQIKTRNFLQSVQSILQYTSLLEVIGCTIIVCLVEYFAIMEWEDNDAVALCLCLIGITSISFNIFIFCFIGETTFN